MRNGIVIAGHACVDVHKEVTGFPGPHDLVQYRKREHLAGRAGVQLRARSGAAGSRSCRSTPAPASAYDGYGDEVLKGLSKYKNIDTSMIRREGLTVVSRTCFPTYTRASAPF